MTQFIDPDLLNKRMSLPWTEKYRPCILKQIVSHDTTLTILQEMIDKNNFPNIILYGPPGTGKTTTVSACARLMYGKSYDYMVLELNGSDERGINVVRDIINQFASNTSIDSLFNTNNKKQKLVILDEADSMTLDAQFALRNVMESNSKTTRFCLICNYYNKIITALISRSCTFRFPPIPFDLHLKHIISIVEYENLEIEYDALCDIIKLSGGDMRKSINMLQSLTMVYKGLFVTKNMLYENICQPLPTELEQINTSMLTLPIKEAYEYIKKIENDNSLDPIDIINNFIEYILINKTFDNLTLASILSKLSTIEYNLSIGSSKTIQLGAIIASLKL